MTLSRANREWRSKSALSQFNKPALLTFLRDNLKRFGPTLAALPLLSACASTLPAMQEATAVEQHVASTTLPSGWRVDCDDDHYKAQKTCYVRAFATDSEGYPRPFEVQYVNGRGPILEVNNDYPGTTPSVRIDDGPVLTSVPAIVRALQHGGTAYVVFNEWPDGEKHMAVSLAGFGEAYAKLLAMI